MNRLPWARLMTPMTPKISVNPLLIRNSNNPYCRPFRIWASNPVRLIRPSGANHLAARARVGERLGRDADHAVLAALGFAQIDRLHRVVRRGEGERAARAVDLGPDDCCRHRFYRGG